MATELKPDNRGVWNTTNRKAGFRQDRLALRIRNSISASSFIRPRIPIGGKAMSVAQVAKSPDETVFRLSLPGRYRIVHRIRRPENVPRLSRWTVLALEFEDPELVDLQKKRFSGSRIKSGCRWSRSRRNLPARSRLKI